MVPKEMIQKNLTQFVTECENDLALSQFVEKIYDAKFAHSTRDIKGNKQVFVLFNNLSSKVYTPQELIEEILEDESRISKIPPVVHPIKDHMEYKKRVNRFE